MSAARLIYPLRLEQRELQLLLMRRCRPTGSGLAQGRLIVAAIESLGRAERIARELTPFDPAGL